MHGLVSTEAGWWFMVGADDAHQTVVLVVDRPWRPQQRVILTAAEAALLGEALGRAGERELRARHSAHER